MARNCFTGSTRPKATTKAALCWYMAHLAATRACTPWLLLCLQLVSMSMRLISEAMALLETGRHDVWDALTRRFESKLILTALGNTRGRRIEAAQKLGIGRNTITRKIQIGRAHV